MISLSTGSLYHLPLPSILALAEVAGFDGVELVLGPQTWRRGAAQAVALAQERGLAVPVVHQTLVPLIGGAPAQRLTAAVRAGLAAGCACVVVHPPAVRGWEHPQARRWLAALDEAARDLRGTGTRIALENPGYSAREAGERILGRLPDLAAFCDERDLDVTFDVCHAAIQGLDVLQSLRALQPRVRNVHLSNLLAKAPVLDLPYVRPLFVEHRLPGDGVIPMDDFVKALADDGYAGSITCEVSPMALGAWSPSRLRDALTGLAGYVRSRQAEGAVCAV